ncbi:hypothetical protein BKA65DRAFT_1142 [Rhexocercosporidium sp. MPI-PUGE-AT-0058]|nr:hypothetical protein BKA65DRAFT_1142 [Rhexocercosporidium sp. MPI-PUGE-AT-0058]
MAMTSVTSRVAPLKRYSTRVNNTTEKPPVKRKLSEDSQSVVDLPPVKKFARSSIQSYFQPLSSSSSTTPTRSGPQSSDSLEPTPTPPSSPPSKEAISPPVSLRRPHKRPKRRLSTKPRASQIVRMPPTTELSSSVCSQCLEDYVCLKHRDVPYPLTDKYIEGDAIDHGPSSAYVGSYATSAPCVPSPAKFASASGANHWKQTHLRLSSIDTRVCCQDCGYLYDKTLDDDRKAHEVYHDEIVNCSADASKLYPVTLPGCFPSFNDSIIKELRCIRVHRNSPLGCRSYASRVLDKVNKELGCEKANEIGRSHIFIALFNNRAVAAVIVERISKAGAYIRARGFGDLAPLRQGNSNAGVANRVMALKDFGHVEEEISTVHATNNIHMCVDRIWVDEEFRRGAFKSIHFASYILDVAREHFIDNYVIPKTEVAFSRPTNLGYKFACEYFRGVFDQLFPSQDVKLLVNSAESVHKRQMPGESR